MAPNVGPLLGHGFSGLDLVYGCTMDFFRVESCVWLCHVLSSDGWGDPLEQSYLGVGNSKTRRTLCQQLTIIYCLMFRLHTVAQEREREREREREKICKGLQTDTPSPPQPN